MLYFSCTLFYYFNCKIKEDDDVAPQRTVDNSLKDKPNAMNVGVLFYLVDLYLHILYIHLQGQTRIRPSPKAPLQPPGPVRTDVEEDEALQRAMRLSLANLPTTSARAPPADNPSRSEEGDEEALQRAIRLSLMDRPAADTVSVSYYLFL
jgi:hypothetical protein